MLKIIKKTVLLGRLESSKEYIAENTPEEDKSNFTFIEELKIYVRNLNKDDILKRDLPKNTSGVLVTSLEEGSPLMFLSTGDIIVELQKKKILNSKQFSKLVNNLLENGEKTLLFAIYNANNQRTYLTVKLK